MVARRASSGISVRVGLHVLLGDSEFQGQEHPAIIEHGDEFVPLGAGNLDLPRVAFLGQFKFAHPVLHQRQPLGAQFGPRLGQDLLRFLQVVLSGDFAPA